MTELYRYFGSEGELLYIGISVNSVARMCQHKSGSHWFDLASRVEIERFKTRQEALDAERNAIKAEKPIHNIMHNGDVDQEKAELERVAESNARRSYEDLVRTITYKPLYQAREAGELLFPSSTGATRKVKELIESGHLRGILSSEREFNRNVNGTIKPSIVRDYWITGWAIIEFIEAIESGEIDARVLSSKLHKRL